MSDANATDANAANASKAPKFDYNVVKGVLSDVEKDRIVAIHLNTLGPINVDWDKATEQFGSASVSAFRKGWSNTAKKLQAATDAHAKGEHITPSQAASASKKSIPKKRKSTAFVAEDDDGDDDIAEGSTPTPKKKSRKSGGGDGDGEGATPSPKEKAGRKAKKTVEDGEMMEEGAGAASVGEGAARKSKQE